MREEQQMPYSTARRMSTQRDCFVHPYKDQFKNQACSYRSTPINMLNMPKGCAFCPRCDAAMKICLTEKPEEIWVGEDHLASCWMNIKNMMEEGKSNE